MRQRILRVVATIVLSVMFACAAEAKPNIVIIVTDDQAEELTMGVLPDGRPLLPKIKSLVLDQGVRFVNSFADFPLCCPYRASLLTGQASHNHGIKTNKGGWFAYRSREPNSLPVWLQAAGYKTAIFGKYINDYGKSVSDGRIKRSSAPTTPPGWNEWFVFYGRGGQETEGDNGYFNWRASHNGTVLDFGTSTADYSTDVVFSRAVDFILAQDSNPFFVLITPKAPHVADKHPALPAPRHKNVLPYAKMRVTRTSEGHPAYNEANTDDKPAWVKKLRLMNGKMQKKVDEMYQGALLSLLAVDEGVEAVINAISKAGKLDNTFLCFTSDNGWFYGEHRIVKGKAHGYEPSLRVPLACRGPGIPAAEIRVQLVNNLDLAATIIDWAGARPGVALDGASLAPAFHDARAPWRSAIFFEGRTSRSETQAVRGVRTAARKYMLYDDGSEELYDLERDPDELENRARADEYKTDLDKLRELTRSLQKCSGSACWVP